MISAEKCLAQIIEKSPSNIYMFDVDTLRFVYANAAATQIPGYTIEELREMTVIDIIPEHSVDSIRVLLLPLTQNFKIRQEVTFETTYKDKNGNSSTVEFRIQRGNYDNNPVYVAFALDNSNRIQAGKTLQGNEKRFSVAEQLAHIGSWEMNIVSNTLLWSDEVYRIFGLRPQQIGATYKAFKEVVHPDDWEMVEDAYVKSLKRCTPYNIEHRLLLKDGSIKYVIQHYESFFDDNGRAFRSVGTIQDITTQKEQEKDLLRFRTAIDASPDAIYFTNPETMRFLYVNRAATQRTGYSREQLLQFGPERILNIDRVQIKRDYDEAVAAGDKGAVGEVKIITKSGVRLWSELRRHALLMDDQWTLITFARDITERKKHEDELLQFRAAMDVSPDAIAITDVDSMRFLYVNEVAADRLGYTRDELLRLSPTDTLGIDSRALKRIYDEVIAAGDKGKGTSMEMVIITKTGVELWSDIRRRAIQLDNRWVIVSMTHDLTRRKQRERELQQAHEELENRVEERTRQLRLEIEQRKSSEQRATKAQDAMRVAMEEAEKASKAKTEFLSSMSHELRTPLNCILGFAQLLELSEAEFDSKQKVHIRHILSSGEHLLNLVTDVLELHTIEEGRMSLKFDHVSADEVIEDCLNQIQFRARESEVQLIDGRKAQETLPRLWTDATRLKQLLLNLLSNAIKYNEEGGTVTISCSEMPGNMLRICVADTGAGIPLDRRKDLFTPFERLGRETGPIEGSGIGLSIAKRLIELLSGNIGYDSEVGKGSTFWVDIPLSQEQDLAGGDVESVVSAAPEQLTSPMEESNSRVILYIEDDPDNQSLMGHILARMPEFKIELLTAHNAELGLDLARKHRPDVVLLDINLPGMNGIDAVQKLKLMQETKAIPVIAISADATPQAIEGAMQHGFESYITKPINVREIQQTISKFLKPPTTH